MRTITAVKSNLGTIPTVAVPETWKRPVRGRLLRTPRPYFDENLKGLIVRAAEENGYHAPSIILSLAELKIDGKTGRTMYTKQRLRNLSEVLDVDITTLRDLACLTGIEETPPKAYNIFGHRIHKYSVRTTAPKVCPGCLRESNYIRKIWDLAAFTCCPEHGTLLIEKCPKCGRKMSWNRHKVSECACGQDWRQVPLPEASKEERILSRLILEVCKPQTKREATIEGKKDSARLEDLGFNPLSRVTLSELLSAVYFIGGLLQGVVDVTGKQFASKLPHRELHEALSKAVTVFEEWPKNFHKFIEESKGKVSTGGRQSGLYKDFGKMYDPLFIRKRNPLPDFMREAFKDYLMTMWDGGYAGWCGSVSKEDLERKKYMTKQETARYLCVAIHTVDRLYKKGFLDGFYYPWVNRSRIMIEAESVRKLKERWQKSINAVQAGEKLGIGRIAVASLHKSGCLAAIQGPAVTGQLEWKFEAHEVEGLLKKVEEKIIGNKSADEVICVDFYKAIQKLSKLSLEAGDFVKLILDGKITPVTKGDGVGLSSLHFNASEIKQFSRDEAIKRRGGKRTLQEAVRLLHSSKDAVLFLIKQGFISADKAVGGRRGWMIDQDEIDRFSNAYSTIGQIADALGTAAKGMSARLIANGVMPVSGPAIDGGSVYFFRRTDLEAADFDKILPVKNNNIQKMNAAGLVSKRQLADVTGCKIDSIDRVLRKSLFIPALLQRRSDGKSARAFFSHEQVEKFRELKAIEASQIELFEDVQQDRRSAA